MENYNNTHHNLMEEFKRLKSRLNKIYYAIFSLICIGYFFLIFHFELLKRSDIALALFLFLILSICTSANRESILLLCSRKFRKHIKQRNELDKQNKFQEINKFSDNKIKDILFEVSQSIDVDKYEIEYQSEIKKTKLSYLVIRIAISLFFLAILLFFIPHFYILNIILFIIIVFFANYSSQRNVVKSLLPTFIFSIAFLLPMLVAYQSSKNSELEMKIVAYIIAFFGGITLAVIYTSIQNKIEQNKLLPFNSHQDEVLEIASEKFIIQINQKLDYIIFIRHRYLGDVVRIDEFIENCHITKKNYYIGFNKKNIIEAVKLNLQDDGRIKFIEEFELLRKLIYEDETLYLNFFEELSEDEFVDFKKQIRFKTKLEFNKTDEYFEVMICAKNKVINVNYLKNRVQIFEDGLITEFFYKDYVYLDDFYELNQQRIQIEIVKVINSLLSKRNKIKN